MKIDTHQHFWKYHPVKDAWITDDMAVLQQDYFPEQVWPLMKACGVAGCVAVQADQSEDETLYLLECAERFPFIQGVVGWIDFKDPKIQKRLYHFAQFPKLKGFRHIVQAEPNEQFLLEPEFCNGIAALAPYNFTYDILIYSKHIPAAVSFAKKFPEQNFILDHLAKPNIREGEFETWKQEIEGFRDLKHVSCKLVGLTTEADWKHWKLEEFTRYLDVVVSVFGVDRLMFGTDWPVCLVGASYQQTCEILEHYMRSWPAEDQEKVWSLNAKRIYNL
jgi:L-fuconolactonase